MKSYKTLYGEAAEEILIEKSRFIGYGKAVHSEDEALSFIAGIQKRHYDATHNVWAYIIGESMSVQRYSDDGEPTGTAGIPVLEVLKKEELTNVVLVVTRYFGGIKLGAGGLVRAYTKSAVTAIQGAGINQKALFIPLVLSLDYSFLGKIQNDLVQRNIPHHAPIFTEKVAITIFSPVALKEDYRVYYTDLTMGNIDICEKEAVYLDCVDSKIILEK